MNARGSPRSVGKFRLAGTISFLSDDSFLGGVMTRSIGPAGKTVRVTLKPGCLRRSADAGDVAPIRAGSPV